jgi:trans-2,3-dihydro-3-hydroxyanthranilate isomerase
MAPRLARFHTLDVFTDHAFGGNPLAVFPEAADFPPGAMQAAARELNLSETVFVLPPTKPGALRRLRIFTPARELPFAGHPTIGTAHLLVELGVASLDGEKAEFVLEEGVGPVPIVVRRRPAGPPLVEFTAARLPERGPEPPPREVLAATLGLSPEEVLEGADRPEAYSCGMRFLFVPLAGRAALGRIQFDLATWRRALAGYWAPEIFVFCREPERRGSDLRARMFGPGAGVLEDPATGSAAAALAGYLATRSGSRDGTQSFVIEQGFEMGRPSLLTVAFDRAAGRLTAVRVGGTAVRVADGEMRVEPAA